MEITYQQAKELLDKWVTDPATRFHSRESEVLMRALAQRLGENEELWGIAGLLHDIDWDQTKTDSTRHCVLCRQILKDAGASDFLIETIVSHGYGMEQIPALKDKQRSTAIQYCLAAAETLTGIITAAALVQPDKKLQSVSLKSLKKKFKDKSFAAKCNRNIIFECEKAGIPLDEFLQIGLGAVQNISVEFES
jgi:uncharacterized protein